eukprot:TRINITY_DN14527_c0_g1_i2.p1 TRINITY_DN14527_c0_g1~~TRINITY_DN14527_c0_g1_i2.p1  ORF type:complete len:372 (-),score=65.84 TRINITY_DN14527_c0_g1_i2:38-1153(-)
MRPKMVTEDFLAEIKLRDYQIEIANRALEERRGIIKAATGSGKTVIFSAIVKALGDGVPTMVLFRSRQLVDQTYRVFQARGLQNIGRVHMDFYEPNVVTCCTIQSIHKLTKLVPGIRALIVDECHEFSSTKSVAILKKFKNATWRLGFSATPWKSDDVVHNYRLKSWFGPELCDLGTAELQKQDVLAPSLIHLYPMTAPNNIQHLPFDQAQEIGVFENEILNQSVVKLVNSISSGRILILVRRLSHGNRLSFLMPDAFWIQGADDMATRDFVFKQLSTSSAKKVVAIASPVGYTGIDVHVHHVINAAGGLSPTQTIQKIGRGLRKAADKDRLDYHDFYFSTNPYLRAHSDERVRTLESEGHTIVHEKDILG